MKEVLSSFDIATIVLELRQDIIGKHIDNIYHLADKTFLFKIRPGNYDLVVEIGRRIHLTKYQVKAPKTPSSFCMALRKHLVGGKIIDVRQQEFERITIFEVQRRSVGLKLVIEIFKRGSLIVVDQNGKILLAFKYARMKDRNIIKGEVFKHAPSTGMSLTEIDRTELSRLKEVKSTEIVKALTHLLPIGGLYSEEILKRAGLDKNMLVDQLQDSQLETIHSCLKSLLSEKIRPRIVLDREGNALDVLPFPLSIYEGFELKHYESFNDAVDVYFSHFAAELEKAKLSDTYRKRREELERILTAQEKQLSDLQEASEKNRRIGDTIYTHMNEIQQLLDRILTNKRSGRDWEEIMADIETAKKSGGKPEIYFQELDPKEMRILLSIDNVELTLKLGEKLSRQAAQHYEKSKKARDKLSGLSASMSATKNKLEALESELGRETGEVRPPREKRPKAWYEKFHWFKSSEGYLIVIGKDAVTNELLIKRYTETEDIVLHAEIQGAPFAVIKTSGSTPSQQTILEGAQAAASYSKAWAKEFGSIDVYWVKAVQVSKKAPSGEYLSKGMFMIRGDRNYVKGTELRLSFGIVEDQGYAKLMAGPTSAVKTQTQAFVEIVPGKTPAGKLGKQILAELRRRAPFQLTKLLDQIELEEVQKHIPAGKGDMKLIDSPTQTLKDQISELAHGGRGHVYKRPQSRG